TIIGSNQKEVYNQLEISDMIEARLEELLRLIEKEIERMGFHDVRGGYVLTGGTAKMTGVLELAQEVFEANASIAIPDYIGVREPQYTVGVGTIKFDYRNAKIQEKNLNPYVNVNNEQPVKQKKVKQPKQKEKEEPQADSGEKTTSKVTNFFKSFFE